MQALAEVVLPVFLVLGAGWALAARGLIGAAEVDGLMRFAQGVALPCLLFLAMARLDLAASFDGRLLAAFYGGVAAAFAAGAAGAALWLGRPAADAVAIGFAAAFSNSLLLGLPITARAYGEAALAGNYAIIAIHAPALYAAGIIAMEIARSRGLGLSAPTVAAKAARAIAVQPLVIGIVAGVAVNLSGLPLPAPLLQALDLIGGAALPVALFGLGGVLSRYRVAGDGRAIAMVCALSLLVHPAVTWAIGQALALPVEGLRSAVVTAAMAPGVNAYLFAHSYGAATRVAASAVLFATAACVLTAWGWLTILP